MKDVQNALEYHYYYRYRRFSLGYGIGSAQRERKRNIPRCANNLCGVPFDSRF